MTPAARTSSRFHVSRHEYLNKPFAESVDCRPLSARAAAMQSALMIVVMIAMPAALMWLAYNG